MFNMLDRRAKMAPSHYPRLPFHAIRFFQLVSSLVVGAIMSYFIWHLTHDHWRTPWTFIWLTCASLLSMTALLCTILLHCFTGLNSRFNIAVNSALALLWLLSWSLLTFYMPNTLGNSCDLQHWHEHVGVVVCRIYKVLFTFTFFGLFSTLAALSLDIYVRCQHTRRGVYRQHSEDEKRPAATHGPFTDPTLAYSHYNSTDEPEEWTAPRQSSGPYSESAEAKLRQDGYTVPDHQFQYDAVYSGKRISSSAMLLQQQQQQEEREY